MADTESASAAAGGEKRKYKENTFTAKAESGTLRVKIMRKDQQFNSHSTDSGVTAPVTQPEAPAKKGKGRPRRTRRPPPPSDSPPKPRPNRKHVPIFYEQHHRQQIQQRAANASSTDESAGSSSTTTVPGIHSTSSTEHDASAFSSSSTGSGQYSSLISELRLESSGGVGAPPASNPLFSRNDSDGGNSLGELLRPYFPHSVSGSSPSFPLSSEGPVGTASSAGLLLDRMGAPSALHQLAASSASYRSALDALSAATLASGTLSQSASQSESQSTSASTSTLSTASTAAAVSTSSTELATSSSGTPWQGSSDTQFENYRFNPLNALQSAIDHAHRVSLMATAAESQGLSGASVAMNDTTTSTFASTSREPTQTEDDASSQYYRLDPSEGSTTFATVLDSQMSADLGAPPDAPPPFSLQNSLMGGGIAALASHMSSQSTNAHTDVSTSSGSLTSSQQARETNVNSRDGTDGSGGSVAELGPPPETSPSLSLQNSLMGGGISTLAPPSLRSSLERLRAKAGIAGDTSRATNSAGSRQLARNENDEDSIGASMDLGAPPSGPPAFTIGNSLMGGGIELQPAAAAVNTHNFDWKLHREASTAGLVNSNASSKPDVSSPSSWKEPTKSRSSSIDGPTHTEMQPSHGK